MVRFVTLAAALAFVALASSASLAGVRAAADDLTGDWAFVLETPGGVRNANATFKLDGTKVTGRWDGKADVQGTFADGALDLSFPFEAESGPGTLGIKAKLAKSELTGAWTFQEYSGTFTATRATTAAK